MIPEPSLEGWAPAAGVETPLADIIDRAFDYRGDVTVVMKDGRELTGYVSNRDGEAAEPYLQLLEPSGVAHTLRYAAIRTIRFTGRDTAAGTSYEAWLRRKTESERRPPQPV